jgi:two-component system sensor histidine kinase MtrB
VAEPSFLSRLIGLPGRGVLRIWQRSLLVRVVSATLVLSAAVVAAVGLVLLHQVGQGLVTAQRSAALAELDAGLQSARLILVAPQPKDAVPDDVVRSIVSQLQLSSGRDPASAFQVLLLSTGGDYSGFSSHGPLAYTAVPATLRRVVSSGQEEAYTYVTGPAGSHFLLAGAPIFSPLVGDYEVYYAFPLAEQEQTLALVRTRLIDGGIALVILLGLVAFLVARQVVTPVRLAARVAGRLASGRLTERLEVRGTDDLAKLATSFNAMAAGLQRQIGQLEELSRVQRRFTADVSHELRTPLTTMRMAADMLHSQRGSFTADAARTAELLQSQLDRFESLLADLLEISRYDANAAVLDAEPFDIAALVRDQVGLLAHVALDRGVEIDLSGVPAAAVVVEADPRRVSRILRNLLANAIEHAEGNPVEVLVGSDADAVAVRVRDHGHGLREADLGRVFDRFWRADPARPRHSGGSGLGLSIALEDARLHGGWLQVWGAPGRGAAFRLVLPRTAGAELRSSPVPLVPEPAGTSTGMAAGTPGGTPAGTVAERVAAASVVIR